MDAAQPVVPALVAAIDAGLRERATPERAERERAYLKSEITHYGTTVPQTRAVVKGALKGVTLSHAELVDAATLLWAEPVHERRAAAAALLEARSPQLVPSDIVMLERFLRESRTWALVDDIAATLVGPLVDRASGGASDGAAHRAELEAVLDRWSTDDDFWIRRSALLAHLVPLREGGGNFDRFARYADTMLDEREFFIRKAIGWVLRDTSRKRPELVFAWILPRAAHASGLTVREAIRRLPDTQQAAVLAARRKGAASTAARTNSR
ncbi:DNA alkylation repair protein [Leucobacter sp. 7(1)]|uniref:DNA alkylation repair protein n=1 Tax=Leucobacter sp. 7(1) TaxID=1255613 RepID=UPI000B3618F9|nr:DNA alkylation repair protein [Leucobacter sp. 7(1)]